MNGQKLRKNEVVRFDASDQAVRGIFLQSSEEGMHAIIFSGKQLKEQFVWHGPFVASSQQELQRIFRSYQSGNFPPKRVPWDYKTLSEFPQKE